MKICPICQKIFADNMNFCLEDGTTLSDCDYQDPERTLEYSDDRKLKINNQTAGNYDPRTSPQNQKTNPYEISSPAVNRTYLFGFIGGAAGLFLLFAIGIVGAIYTRQKPPIEPYPTPDTYPSVVPSQKPTDQRLGKLDVKIVGKVKGSFNSEYYKCLVTNKNDRTIENPGVSIILYDKDVKVGNIYGDSPMKYLKPNQTIPIWVRIYSKSKYTSAEAETSKDFWFTSKNDETLFLEPVFTETGMKVEKKTSMYNFQSYRENFYIVSGIIENPKKETSMPRIFITYYDENSEIVGFVSTGIGELKKGEKAKFSAQAGATQLFGTPKRFEITAVDGR